MRRGRSFAGLLAGLIVAGASSPAAAQVVLEPTSASTSMGTATGGSSVTFVINQFGLSAPYTGGTTNFASYVAAAPTHNSAIITNIWTSNTGNVTGNFDFNLGSPYTVSRFAFWNLVASNQAVQGFDLLASLNPSFTNPVNLGSFTATNAGTTFAAPVQAFSFAPTNAQFLRMRITSNFGNTQATGFGEATFGGVPVPEPSSLALGAFAAVSGAFAWRRRKRLKPAAI
jgi:hypothetical protein